MLMRTDPFQEFDRITRCLPNDTARPAVMPMDAYRDGDTFVLCFDLPGVRADSIDLEVERDVLTVRAERESVTEGRETIAAERPVGSFSRRLLLGEALDTDRIRADHANGVLTLRVPVAGHAKPRRISVTEAPARAIDA